jgi:predicted RNA-binding Zn-ribbon protein involved in translation (DUF1610 family)
MSEQKLFPCCDCGEFFYEVSLSDEDTESYEDEVKMTYDEGFDCWVPDITSFEQWLNDHEHLDGNYHACPDCGSDS